MRGSKEVAPDDFVFLQPDAHRFAITPLSFEAFVVALNKHEAGLHWRERDMYKSREEALNGARRRDSTEAGKRRKAGDKVAHVGAIWIEGEEAELRREYGLPPRLVHDMGGKGNFARLDFLLAIAHLKHCLRHPACASHFALGDHEIELALGHLAVLEGLAFGDELRARVWTRIVTPHSPVPYIGIGTPEWTPHSAFEDFFRARHPASFVAGFDSGLKKIRYETERDLRWDAVNARSKSDAVRRGIEACYGLPSLLAVSERQLLAANQIRALHILIDGFPDRFAGLKTARSVFDFIYGIPPDEADCLESYFCDDEASPD